MDACDPGRRTFIAGATVLIALGAGHLLAVYITVIFQLRPRLFAAVG